MSLMGEDNVVGIRVEHAREQLEEEADHERVEPPDAIRAGGQVQREDDCLRRRSVSMLRKINK